jgi:hypothetical protein
MAFSLTLSTQLAKAGWKVKIRDRERLEEPHVTILRVTSAWRLGLRSRAFLDDGSWNDFPKELRESIEANWELLCREWDQMYPHNPVPAEEEDEHGDENE